MIKESKSLDWLNENVIYRVTKGDDYVGEGEYEGDDEKEEKQAEELWQELCQESKASDFYVHVYQHENRFPGGKKAYINVCICPVLWFDKHSACLDVTPRIKHLWPNYVRGECTEGVMSAGTVNLSSGHTVEKVINDLVERGFIINETFSKHVETSF